MLLSIRGFGRGSPNEREGFCFAQAAKSQKAKPGSGKAEAESKPASADPVSARTDFRISVSEALDNTDPHNNTRQANTTAIGLLYEGLFYVNDHVELSPRLAESYTVSEDGLVYEYALRKGVKFHNGDEMKASDVVFSFERGMESPTLYSVTQHIASVEAVDDYTVRITLNGVYALLYYLDSSVAYDPALELDPYLSLTYWHWKTE